MCWSRPPCNNVGWLNLHMTDDVNIDQMRILPVYKFILWWYLHSNVGAGDNSDCIWLRLSHCSVLCWPVQLQHIRGFYICGWDLDTSIPNSWNGMVWLSVHWLSPKGSVSCWKDPMFRKPSVVGTQMGSGRTWLLAMSVWLQLHAQFHEDCQGPKAADESGTALKILSASKLSQHTAPFAISSNRPKAAIVAKQCFLHYFMHTFFSHSCNCKDFVVLIVHRFITNVHVTLKNALFEIYSFPVSPLRVINGSKALEIWVRQPQSWRGALWSFHS